MERPEKRCNATSGLTTMTLARQIMADEQVARTSGGAQPDSPKRTCNGCGETKPRSDFYVSSKAKCKECIKASVRADRAAKADYYRAYDRKRYRDQPKRKIAARLSSQSEAGVRSRMASTARSRIEQPEKYKARNAVNNALRDGKIERTPCYFCGGVHRLQAHHEDYDHPLDVVWLCASCHGKLHTIKGDFRRAKA